MGASYELSTQILRARELHRAGRSSEAARLLIEAARVGPEAAATYELLADIERTLGNRTAESSVLERFATFEPLNADAWKRLGSLYAECGRPEDAARAFARASKLAPGERSHWEGLALTALSAQRLSLAQEARDQLLKRFADRGFSHVVAGHIHKATGQYGEAMAAYTQALALSPGLSEALFNLVDLRTPLLGDPLATQAQSLSERPDISDEDRANAGFATARIYEAAKHYDAAFAHYQSANAAVLRVMRRKGISYSPEST
jgi:tetratricopeptide (TPR) repeat protein